MVVLVVIRGKVVVIKREAIVVTTRGGMTRAHLALVPDASPSPFLPP